MRRSEQSCPPPPSGELIQRRRRRRAEDELARSTESFASAAEFHARWRADPAPGCLMLDIMMPGLDGLQLQQELLAFPQELPIIFHRSRVMVKMQVASVADLVRAPEKIDPEPIRASSVV